MGTQDATSGTTSIDNAERSRWFATFGYTGDPEEVVSLRLPADHSYLGKAAAGDIWRVFTSLRKLNSHDNIMFRRLVTAAAEGFRPVDRDRVFAEDANGALTHPDTGEFQPGIVNIILALVEVDIEEMDGRFVEHPFARKENRAAA